MFMRDIREGQTLYFTNRPPVTVKHVYVREYGPGVSIVHVYDEDNAIILAGPKNFSPEGLYSQDPKKTALEQVNNASYHLEKALDAMIQAQEIYHDISMEGSHEMLEEVQRHGNSAWDLIDNHEWPGEDDDE